MSGKKIMVILRGLPGSGKSSYAEKLYAKFNGPNFRVRIFSANSFFWVDIGGEKEYRFDSSKIGQAHQTCLSDVSKACRANVPMVIVDNANSQKWEYANYEQIAALTGYEISIREVGASTPVLQSKKWHLMQYFERQTHGISLDHFLRMWWRWEEDDRANNLSPADTDPNVPLEIKNLTVEELDGC